MRKSRGRLRRVEGHLVTLGQRQDVGLDLRISLGDTRTASTRAIGDTIRCGRYGEGIFVQYDGLLPEEHNDFIFAIIGHQWGLVGCLLVLIAYSVY